MVTSSKHHIALLASPGFGHLIPIIELAKRLVAQHGLTISIFAVTPEVPRAEDQLLRAAISLWPGHINAMTLPSKKQDCPSNEAIIPYMLSMVRAAFPAMRAAIADMKDKPIALIVDQFGTEAIETIALEFGMLKYVFIASNARFLSYNLYLPYLEKEVNRDEPFYIPGCEPVLGEDLPELTFKPECRAFEDIVRMGRDIAIVDGILVNTWEDLEAQTLLAFKDLKFMKHIVKAPVYPIGPVVRTGEPTGLKSELIKWLDRQPKESVVFVSFGSGGTISTQQTIELALGLELSKQRFIWVFRPPIENDSAASLFKSMHGEEELFKYLPDGFMDRTRDIGFMVPMWAPQEKILPHRSIGAFVCHCGWNSTLESIVNGVPLIAWPLYAEQNMNATMLVKNLGIAVRSQVKPSKELVTRDEIAKMVRRVMVDKEGIGIRTRVNELKASANKALKEGGSSNNSLSEILKRM